MDILHALLQGTAFLVADALLHVAAVLVAGIFPARVGDRLTVAAAR